jgi:hypothetical protein
MFLFSPQTAFERERSGWNAASGPGFDLLGKPNATSGFPFWPGLERHELVQTSLNAELY